MSLQKINTRTIVLVSMMLVASLMRLISYEYPYTLSLFTPLAAIGLFGGAYFTDKWKAYLVVSITLFLSDIFINYLYTSKLMFWYSGAIWVYLPFLLMVFIGSFIKKVTWGSVAIAAFVSVAVHWLISDLPWLYGTRYPHNFAGYMQSLTAAIPFEKNLLMANVVFCSILFGGFELAKSKYSILRGKKELAV
jgi:hypothetical protein